MINEIIEDTKIYPGVSVPINMQTIVISFFSYNLLYTKRMLVKL